MSRHIFVAIFGWQVFYWYMIYLPTTSQRYGWSRKFIVLLVLLIFLKLFWNISNRSYFFALNFPILANSEFQANPQSCYSLKSALCFRKLLKNQFRSCIIYSKLGTMCPSLFHCFFSLWNNKHFLIISPVFHPFPLPPSLHFLPPLFQGVHSSLHSYWIIFGISSISSKLYTTTGESINSPYITWKFLQDFIRANVIDLGFIFFGFTGFRFYQDLKSYPKLTRILPAQTVPR